MNPWNAEITWIKNLLVASDGSFITLAYEKTPTICNDFFCEAVPEVRTFYPRGPELRDGSILDLSAQMIDISGDVLMLGDEHLYVWGYEDDSYKLCTCVVDETPGEWKLDGCVTAPEPRANVYFQLIFHKKTPAVCIVTAWITIFTNQLI